MPHTPGPPERYTFSARVSGDGEDWTDIEMRSDTEKYTVATVEDRFAPLFLAAPEMLAMLEKFMDISRYATPSVLIDSVEYLAKQVAPLIAKAKGEEPKAKQTVHGYGFEIESDEKSQRIEPRDIAKAKGETV